jgi:hypothetical protein
LGAYPLTEFYGLLRRTGNEIKVHLLISTISGGRSHPAANLRSGRRAF